MVMAEAMVPSKIQTMLSSSVTMVSSEMVTAVAPSLPLVSVLFMALSAAEATMMYSPATTALPSVTRT